MNVLSFIIEAKDKASGVLNNIKSAFSDLGSSWTNAIKGMKEGSFSGMISLIGKIAPAVAAAGAALKGLGEAVKFAAESIDALAKIETLTIRLSRVTGGMEEARQAMRALTEGKDSVKDLFGDEDVLRAAMTLKKLSGGILGSAADIKILAGAAYDTGQSISSVAQDIGGLTGMITEGVTGWERYAKGLAKAGVMSFETIKQMSDMKDADKSAGEIVSFMWAALEKDHSGAIDQARDSIEGLHKKSEEAAHGMKIAFGELFEPIGRLWDHIKIGFSDTIAFIVKGLTSIPKSIGTFLGALSGGASVKDAYNMVLDNAEAEKNTQDKASGNVKDQVDAKASKSDEQKTSEKKAADEHAELLKKKEEAQKKYDEAQRTRKEQAAALEQERNGLLLETQSKSDDGTNDQIKKETRILEIAVELKKIKEEIAKDEAKAAEEEAKRQLERLNAEDKARKGRKVEQSQYTYHATFDKMTPEQQLATTEANIKRWKKNLAEAGTEEEKAAATKGLIGQLQERDKIQKEMVTRDEKRKKESESLMTRDRELRESAMTPEQRIAESKKRAAALEKQLAGEKDPDKQLEIKSKLMDEAEKQNSLAKKENGARSMSIGDVFEKGYGQSGRKDPAHEQVEISKDIRALLKNIEKKKGGMAP